MFLRDCRHIAVLIFSDLRFEWILSTCMVLALTAVFAPLFILLGLQEGIVGNMLDRLRSDPVSRLVTPKSLMELPLDDAWLQSLQERSDVVITSPAASILLNVEGLDDPVNAVPTAPADPLLVENRVSFSGGDRSIVLSERLAQHSGKNVGDSFVVTLIRNTGQEERVPMKFHVAGILPKSASDDDKMWLPENLFRWFYRWRRGHAVPELGLAGRGAILTPEYDGALTLLDRVPTDEEYRKMIAGKMSFSRPPEPLDEPGWRMPRGRSVRLWRSINSRIFEENLAPLANRHNELGYAVEVVPFLDSFEVTLKVCGRNERMTLTVLPTASTPPDATGTDRERTPHVWASPGDEFHACAAGEIFFQSGRQGKEIGVPVEVCPSHLVQSRHLGVPRDLAGKMNAARRQEAVYDRQSGEFIPSDEGMRFFRAYARSIDELEDLVEFVRSEGEQNGSNALREPNSKVGEVRNIRRLAGYMRQLYQLIVVVSGTAGFFAIAASVYAGVQRKRHDLAYLQLLGLHPGVLYLFPFLKSLVLVAGGIFLALAFYFAFGHVSSRLFLPAEASLTRLTLLNLSILVTGILAASSAASLLAALAVTRIEPGEYIRE